MGDYVIRASEMRIFRVYIYHKVYGGSRCERVEEREGGRSEGGDVTYVMTSSGPLKYVYTSREGSDGG